MIKSIIPHNCQSCKRKDPEYGNACMLMPNGNFQTLEDQFRQCPIQKISDDLKRLCEFEYKSGFSDGQRAANRKRKLIAMEGKV